MYICKRNIRLTMIQELFIFTPFEWCIITCTLISFIALLLYYIILYGRPVRQSKKTTESSSVTESPSVSVIVYSDGNSDVLREHLPAILTQNYPDYEVIVVNDGSDPETEDVLKLFSHEHKHLYYTFVPTDTQYLSHKKLALTMGIKAAKHETLLFTEASCKPLTKNWIRSMANAYAPETDIILGYCRYPENSGLMHKLVSYDLLTNGLRYLSSALAHHPFTGDGKNLSYKRHLFFEQKGYAKSLNLHAGADDLFINSIATKRNTTAVFTSESLTESDKLEDWSYYKEMKISRAATRPYYKGGRLSMLRLESLFFYIFSASGIALIVAGLMNNWILALTGVLLGLIRLCIKSGILRRSAILLEQKPLTGWIWALEWILPAYNCYIWVYRLFKGKNDYTARI